MRFEKTVTILFLMLAVALVSAPGFTQDKGEKVVTFSGLIESIPKDGTYIVVSEARVLVAGAKIVSDLGSTLSITDLKPKLYVTVEAVQKRDGIFAKKVTVNSSSKIPKTLRNALK
jgi:hypothetical protein